MARGPSFALSLVFLVATAAGAELGPKRASDIVHLRSPQYLLLSNQVGVPLDASIVGGLPGSFYGYAGRTVLTDPSGATALEFEFPIGFAVPAGGTVCVGSSIATPQVKLEGYFAPAK